MHEPVVSGDRDRGRPMGLRDALSAALRRLAPERADTVAMLHPGRCGSTVLGTMLGDRSDVHWDGEVFEPHRRHPVPEVQAGRLPTRCCDGAVSRRPRVRTCMP